VANGSTQDPLWQALYHSFLKMYHEDHANASMHCATVRYSPLTFRLAEQIDQLTPSSNEVLPEIYTVMVDRGVYQEDPGR
jgi:hypothetical protein